MVGGYDDGYLTCPCFWGTEPGSLVRELVRLVPSVSGWRVLDVGCGEGKNAVFLAERGAHVTAIDVSPAALRNARMAWGNSRGVDWNEGDARTLLLPDETYDLVIAYGLLHCLERRREIEELILKFKRATRVGGFNILCAFNDRHHDLAAHPGFSPTLLPHEFYCERYGDWDRVIATDTDLHEVHPHNCIPHAHSLSRLLVSRPAPECER